MRRGRGRTMDWGMCGMRYIESWPVGRSGGRGEGITSANKDCESSPHEHCEREDEKERELQFLGSVGTYLEPPRKFEFSRIFPFPGVNQNGATDARAPSLILRAVWSQRHAAKAVKNLSKMK